jgi:hypothetical protein
LAFVGLVAIVVLLATPLEPRAQSRQETIRTITQTFGTGSILTLSADFGSAGNVRVRTHQRLEIQIQASVRMNAITVISTDGEVIAEGIAGALSVRRR